MNRDSFETHAMRELAPALQPGKIVVADNLWPQKSGQVIDLPRTQGNGLILLPPYWPDSCVAKRSPQDWLLDAPHPSEWRSQSSRP